jgi:hypothetical protein
MESIRESLVCDIEGCSSASRSLELARFIGLKSKLKPAFVLDRYYVALLGHYVMRTKLVVPRENGRLGGLAGLVGEYVNVTIYINSYSASLSPASSRKSPFNISTLLSFSWRI